MSALVVQISVSVRNGIGLDGQYAVQRFTRCATSAMAPHAGAHRKRGA